MHASVRACVCVCVCVCCVCFDTNIAEFLERDLSIAILVCVEDCLVHNLLQLLVREVAADHRLEHLEQLSIADVPILVNVVDVECN